MKLILLLAALLGFSTLFAKDTSSAFKTDSLSSHSQPTRFGNSHTVYVGPGLGLDYAGLGLKVEILPVNWVGLFATMGTSFTGLSYNLGVSLKMLPGNKINPAVQATYGYNGLLTFKDSYDRAVTTKEYYGITLGATVDLAVGKNSNFVSVGLLVPLRNGEFMADLNKNATVLPVAFSLGIKFPFL